MSAFWIPTRPFCLFTCLALASCGCGSATTVTGQVTYEGTPVSEGYITFFPTNEKDTGGAAPIKDGVYTLSTLQPGPHLYEVTASKKIKFALSTEEMEAKFKSEKAKGNATGIVESADLIPPNAINNRLTIDVKPGRQTVDVHLKKP